MWRLRSGINVSVGSRPNCRSSISTRGSVHCRPSRTTAGCGCWRRIATSSKRLNREQTEGAGTAEVVWSAGETLAADAVVNAFRLAPDKRAALQRDSLPTTFKGSLLGKIFFWIFIVALILMLFRCGSGGGPGDCSETRNTFGDASQEYQNCLASQRSGSGYRSGGGSFGGFSSGGGHK